jgi:asparagine synthase (glutamine-hydrolysing)
MCETLSKSYSEPFSDSSQLATLFLASKISKNHKVILTGDGGDELFGGYSRYVKYNTISKLNSLLKFDKTNFLNKIINNLAKQKILSSFATLNNLLRISETSKITSNNSEFFDVLISHKSINLFKEKISNNKKKYENIYSAIDLMKKDFKFYLPDDLLIKMDRACMFYGVENRSPFLCKDLISYVISDVPIDHKIKNNNGKYILKDILADYLPTSLINKKKQGFVIPLKEWLINDMNAWASELLKPDHLNNFNEYNINKIIHLWKNIKNISYDEVYALWDVLVFQNWYYRRNV